MTSWTTGLLDDAAVLGGRALPPALQDHQASRRGPGGDAVGCFAVTEHELPHLRTGDLPVHLAVTGGAGALEAALRWVHGQPGRLAVRRVSVRLRGEETPARNAQRVVAVLDSLPLPDDVEVHAAPPPGPVSPAWLSALDELALREVGLLLDATAPDLAEVVDAALDRELPLLLSGSGADDVRAAMTVVRTVLDGAPPPDGWLDGGDLGGGSDAAGDLAVRTRRWVRAVLVHDLPATLAALTPPSR